MMSVELKIKIPESWIIDISQKFLTPIKFIKCLPHGEEGGRELIEINTDNEKDIENIFREIEKHPNVCKVDFSFLNSGGVLGSITTKMCVACRVLTSSDCFLESAISDKKGFVKWNLITISNNSFRKFIEKIENSGCEIEIRKIRKLNKKTLLTPRQDEMLRIAYEKGYFDFPKKTTLIELCNNFNISPSTLHEILQRGEKKIIFHYLNKEKFKID